MPLKFVVFYGSMRTNRLGIRVANYLVQKLKDRGHEVNLVDAREENLPVLDKRYMDYPEGKAPEQLEKLRKLYRESDGFLAVTGEYNHTLQPGLKNLLDHFFVEYFHRPSAIACYSSGRFGGVRAANALRILLGTLGMPAIPSILIFPEVRKVFDENSKLLDPAFEKRTMRFLNELEWYAGALKRAREESYTEDR